MSKKRKVWALSGEAAKKPLRYTGCGLDDIWLISGYDVEEVDGESALSIRDLDGLHRAIGRSLAERKKILAGKEVRFLRKQMDLTQSELARLVGCDPQQIARYEKGENRIPGPTDRILRMLYEEELGGHFSVREVLKKLDELDARDSSKQTFEETSEGWKAAA